MLEQPGDLRFVGANRQWRNALDNDDIAKAHNQASADELELLHAPLTSSATVRRASLSNSKSCTVGTGLLACGADAG